MDRRRFIQMTAAAATVSTIRVAATQEAAAAPGASAEVLSGRVGFIDNHVDPRVGSLVRLDATYGFALDSQYRTVGVELDSSEFVNAIELRTDRPTHRLNYRDLAVYTSDDNEHWIKRGAEFLDLGDRIWMFALDVTARYVAVHCHREGSEFTFANSNLQEMMRVHQIPPGSFTGHGGGQWRYRTRLCVYNPGDHSLNDRCTYLSFKQLGAASMVRDGRMKEDLSDLRFADESGHQLHALTDGDGVYIRVPAIGPKQALMFDAWTGNPAATSVLEDAAAVAVEYGHRTYQPHENTSEEGEVVRSQIHPLRLPDGTLLIASGTSNSGGIHARYSFDDGRTWSVPEPLIPPSDPSRGRDLAGGFLVDPDTNVVTAVFYSVGVRSGDDMTDPTQNLCQLWVSQARQYEDQRPVFEAPWHQTIQNHESGAPAAWTLTYTDPIKTSSGAYVVSVPYAYRPNGEFALAVLRSIDGGETWTQSATPLTLPASGREGGVSESAIAERQDGSLVIYARQQHREKFHFGTSESHDDGVTWAPRYDSKILASNTQPTMLTRGNNLLLGWSGHNALGQKSYRRNNFTLAYSQDGYEYYGYHDMTTAMRLSTPGWRNRREQRQMVESFIAPAGEDDLIIASAGSLQARGSTILVENIDRYLHDSHSAADILRHYDPGERESGRELAHAHWWRSTQGGSLDLVDGPRQGSKAIRLSNTDGVEVGASRIFPGARTARIRFRLQWSDLAGGLRLALQEGYANIDYPNVGTNARGTVAQFKFDSDGMVLTTTDDVYDAEPVGGWQADDVDPEDGRLTFLEYAPLALDYLNRSVGLDLIKERDIDSIVLTGSDQFSPNGETRLEPKDLTIWASDNNDGDWREITGWTGSKNGLVITLNGPSFRTRYVKVNQPYGDEDFTFANYLEELVVVFPERPDIEHPQVFSPLQVPTRLDEGVWHAMEMEIDLDSSQVRTIIDGVVVSEVPPLRSAETLTHFMLLGGADGLTDVSLADLVVQDTSLGLPKIRRTGRPGVPAD